MTETSDIEEGLGAGETAKIMFTGLTQKNMEKASYCSSFLLYRFCLCFVLICELPGLALLRIGHKSSPYPQTRAIARARVLTRAKSPARMRNRPCQHHGNSLSQLQH